MSLNLSDYDPFYPDSDGERIAENTLQFNWIMSLFREMSLLFNERNDVFIAADLFWYPVEGKPKIVTAPDLMLAFGRPRGDRFSYMQWREDDISPQVVFEVLAPSNTGKYLEKKHFFYQKHGVEEYYLIDPYDNEVWGYSRVNNLLMPITTIADWNSPRLGIRFVNECGDLFIAGPDGRQFSTPREQKWAHPDELIAIKAQIKRNRVQKSIDNLAAKLRELGVDPQSSVELNSAGGTPVA